MGKRKCTNTFVSSQPLSRDEREKISCLLVQPEKGSKSHGNSKSVAWTYFGKLFCDNQMAPPTEVSDSSALADDDASEDTMQSQVNEQNQSVGTAGASVSMQNRSSLIEVDHEHLYCKACLDREQKLYECGNGHGHISKIRKYSLNTSTSTMIDHLFNVHNIQAKDTEKLQLTLSACFSSNTDSKVRPTEAKSAFEYNRDMVIWFCKDLLPFNTVDKDGFKHFFAKNGLRTFPVPSRKTLCGEALQDVYSCIKRKVCALASSAKVISLMFDGWTDKYQCLSFVGIRIGLIDSDWNYRVLTLSVKVLPVHTGLDLANHVTEELRQFGIGSDVTILSTHDGASNMQMCSRVMGVDSFIHCVSHCLHLLLVTDTLSQVPEVREILEKCKKVVHLMHFKGHIIRDEQYKTKDRQKMDQILDAIGDCKVILDADEQFALDDNDVNEESAL